MFSTHISSAAFLIASIDDTFGTYKARETLFSHVNRLATRAKRHFYTFTGSIMFPTQITTIERPLTQLTRGVCAAVMHSTQGAIKEWPVTGRSETC